MTLKYSLIFSALFAFSACGAKSEQKAKTQQVADTVVTSEQMTSAVPEASVVEQNDTLRDSRFLVGIGIYFGKPKKKETFIYNSS